MNKIIHPSKISTAVIILTYNEELHIKRCIESIKDIVDEIFVVDSYSSDQTLDICKKYKKIKIFKHKFINQAMQMNWALKTLKIKSNWIFRLDADEYLTKNSKKIFKDQLKKHSLNKGLILKRKIKFLNKIINYGLTSPHKTLRIWKNKNGKYKNELVDEQIIIKGKISETDLVLIDHNLKGINFWIKKHINYAKREALEYKKNLKQNRSNKDFSKINKLNKYKTYYKFPIIIRPFLLFSYSYFIKLGFLTGIQGLFFYLFQTLIYRLIVDFYILKNKF